MKELLCVDDATVRFPVRRDFLGRGRVFVEALQGVSIAAAEGECLGIVGESGSGKTTLVNTVLGFVELARGHVRYRGLDLAGLTRRRRRRICREIQPVFQDPYASLDPAMAVWASISEGLRVAGFSRAACRARAEELGEMVGLERAKLARRPHAFSGGQRQRIAIARALAVEPRLLILDEPTSALDVSVQARIINLLLDLQQQLGLTYVLVSHDIAVIRHLCHRTAVMQNGRIVESGDTEQVLSNPRESYTQTLIDAVPTVEAATDVFAAEDRLEEAVGRNA